MQPPAPLMEFYEAGSARGCLGGRWRLSGNGFFSGVVHLPSLACLGSVAATLDHGSGLRWPLAGKGKADGPISEWFAG